MNKLAKILKVSRPVSWINTAYPFAIGYLIMGGAVDTALIIATLFFLIPYNIIMYGINDIFDYESDIRNPRKGSIEGAVEAKEFHPFILGACIVIGLPFVIALAFLLPLSAFLCLLAVLFFVFAYSFKGLRFKEIPFLDSITSSIHFVGPLVVAAACFNFPSNAWVYMVAFFIWGVASHAFGAVQDIIPDRKAGLASIATVIGARNTIWFSIILYLISCILIGLQDGLMIVIGLAGTLYVANMIPFVRITDKTSQRTHAGWRRYIWINYIVGAILTIVLAIQTFILNQ